MTCIAWDGKTLAADRRAVSGNMVHSISKIRRIPSGEVLAWAGWADAGLLVSEWYEKGADPATWPACQYDKDRCCTLVVADEISVRYYCKEPIALVVEDDHMAWGCGSDLARAAMHCGRSAREAVEIACLYDNGCGNGVDVFDLLEPALQAVA